MQLTLQPVDCGQAAAENRSGNSGNAIACRPGGELDYYRKLYLVLQRTVAVKLIKCLYPLGALHSVNKMATSTERFRLTAGRECHLVAGVAEGLQQEAADVLAVVGVDEAQCIQGASLAEGAAGGGAVARQVRRHQRPALRASPRPPQSLTAACLTSAFYKTILYIDTSPRFRKEISNFKKIKNSSFESIMCEEAKEGSKMPQKGLSDGRLRTRVDARSRQSSDVVRG